MRQWVSNLIESKKGLIFAFFLSFSLRTILLYFSSDIAIDHDGMIYIGAAMEFARGNFLSSVAAYPLALYPLLIAIVNFFLQDWILSARFVSAASLLLILLPLYFLTDNLFGRRAAFWSCLAFSLSPEPLRLSLLAIRDNPFGLVFTIGVCFAYLAVCTRKTKHLMIAAGAFCLSMQLRIEGLILFPTYMLFLIGLAIVKRNETKIYFQFSLVWMLICVVLLLIVQMAVSSENILFSRFNFNRFIDYRSFFRDLVSYNFLKNYQKIHNHLEIMEKNSPFGTASLSFASISMSNIPIIYMIGLIRGFIQLIYPLNMLAFLFGLKCAKLFRGHSLVLFFAGIYFIMIYFFAIYKDFFDNRFLLPPSLILFPWIGIGIQKAFETLIKKRNGSVLVVALALALLIPCGYKLNLLIDKKKDVVIASGEWLAQQSQLRNARIFSADDRILFYACIKGLCLKGEDFCRKIFDIDYACLEAHTIENRVDVIIISEDKENLMAPISFNGYQKEKEFNSFKKSVSVYYAINKTMGS